MKVAILSAGAVASDVAQRVLDGGGVDELVIADIDEQRARDAAATLGSAYARCDARDAASVADVVKGADVVFNGVGPYYRFGPIVIEQALAAGAHYVDVCDEYDTTARLMANEELDRLAQSKGLTVLTSMGSAPGLTNLTARWASDQLDRVDDIQIVMALPLIVDLGVTINEHMLHSLSGEVTQFKDGQFVDVPAWSDPRTFALLPPFDRGDYHFSYWGHAESVTLPRFIPGLREVSSRFTWLQEEANRVYQNLAALGMTGTDATGLPMSPRQFTAQLMATAAGQQAMSVPIGSHPFAHVWRIEATGDKDGQPTTVAVEGHLDLTKPSMVGPSGHTGLPASMAIRQLLDGTITRRGVVAPEGCIDPEPFITTAYAASGVDVHRSITAAAR